MTVCSPSTIPQKLGYKQLHGQAVVVVLEVVVGASVVVELVDVVVQQWGRGVVVGDPVVLLVVELVVVELLVVVDCAHVDESSIQ